MKFRIDDRVIYTSSYSGKEYVGTLTKFCSNKFAMVRLDDGLSLRLAMIRLESL